MVNVSKYKTIPDFFKGFLDEVDMKPTELAHKLRKSHTAISTIISGKKRAGKPLLIKMSEVFNLDLEQLQKLEQIGSNKAEKYIEDVHEGNQERARKTREEEQQKNANNPILSLLQDDPEALSLLEKIVCIGSEQEKRKLLRDLKEMADSRISTMVKRYSHQDLKKKLLEVGTYWNSLSKLPKYYQNPNEADSLNFSMEGNLELSDASLYFSLAGNDKWLNLTVRHQDRHFIQEQIKLLPGVITTNSSRGNLGKILVNVSLYNFCIFNLASIVSEMKIQFANLDVPIGRVHFDECNIEPYFKNY